MKLKLTDRDVSRITDLALNVFKGRPTFGELSSKEIQVYCILGGLEQYLNSKGIEVGFSLEGFVEQNSDPVDDERDPS